MQPNEINVGAINAVMILHVHRQGDDYVVLTVGVSAPLCCLYAALPQNEAIIMTHCTKRIF